MAEPDRLCDYQAMFLIEVHSQYRARRAAKTLSTHFEKVYRKVGLDTHTRGAVANNVQSAEDFRSTTLQLADATVSLDKATWERWIQWIELATWQRLVLSCYILESQQTLLLAREPSPSLIQVIGLDLPFPGHSSLWDATTLSDWTLAARQASRLPSYVYEVTADLMIGPFDCFQSSVLLAVHYSSLQGPTSYTSSPSTLDIEHLLDGSPATQRKLLTAKILQVTPIRALLAVSGESWILSEKVSSAQKFSSLKTILRTWVGELLSERDEHMPTTPVKEALALSVEILQEALKEQQNALVVEMGSDMGIYFAGLVLWAITTAATSRTKITLPSEPQSPRILEPLLLAPVPSTSVDPLDPFPQQASSFPSQSATPVPQGLLDCPTMLSHAQITINTISFLSHASADFASAESFSQLPRNLARCQTGCGSLLLWVKMRLRGAALEHQSDVVADTWLCEPSEGLGELLDGITRSLERILGRGWNGWDI